LIVVGIAGTVDEGEGEGVAGIGIGDAEGADGGTAGEIFGDDGPMLRAE